MAHVLPLILLRAGRALWSNDDVPVLPVLRALLEREALEERTVHAHREEQEASAWNRTLSVPEGGEHNWHGDNHPAGTTAESETHRIGAPNSANPLDN